MVNKELQELERFKERRKAFGGYLSVKNVHNVPDLFPEMYKKIFHTNTLRCDLFCTNSALYSDADEEIVRKYEEYLNDK